MCTAPPAVCFRSAEPGQQNLCQLGARFRDTPFLAGSLEAHRLRSLRQRPGYCTAPQTALWQHGQRKSYDYHQTPTKVESRVQRPRNALGRAVDVSVSSEGEKESVRPLGHGRRHSRAEQSNGDSGGKWKRTEHSQRREPAGPEAVPSAAQQRQQTIQHKPRQRDAGGKGRLLSPVEQNEQAFAFTDFAHSYSETPTDLPVAQRSAQFSPFGPSTMQSRPWVGGAPLKTQKRRGTAGYSTLLGNKPSNGGTAEAHGAPAVDSVLRNGGVSAISGQGSVRLDAGEGVGEGTEDPLTEEEVEALVRESNKSQRQVNLGRDGVVHNMLELIHTHWKRSQVCRVRCKGVPTVDMDNVQRVIEERTGGTVIRRAGGVLYVFRGRHYSHKRRPPIPLMLWKPPTPSYPPLVSDAPEGLTLEEADALRVWGRRIRPVCRLAKNGVYLDLVRTVRSTLESHPLCKVDCRELDKSDFKKIGAKLRDLVPCTLLSFERNHILMWRDGPGRRHPSAWNSQGPTKGEGITPASQEGIAAEHDVCPPSKDAPV